MKFSYFILTVFGLIVFFSCEKEYADEAYIVLKMEEYPSGEGMDSVFCVVVDQKVYYPKYGQYTTVDEIDEEDILFSGYSSDGIFSRKIDLEDYLEDYPKFEIVTDIDYSQWTSYDINGVITMYQSDYMSFKKEKRFAKYANTTLQFHNIDCSGFDDSIAIKYKPNGFYKTDFFFQRYYYGCDLTDTLDWDLVQGEYQFKWEVYKDQDTLHGDTLITLGSLQQHFVIEM